MDISLKYLQNDMIKPSDNGVLESVVESVTHKVMISDTWLRSFIPAQVCKMTPLLRHICGCELCIIIKDINIGLNIWITDIISNFNRSLLGDTH